MCTFKPYISAYCMRANSNNIEAAYPGAAPIKREIVCRSWYSDLKKSVVAPTENERAKNTHVDSDQSLLLVIEQKTGQSLRKLSFASTCLPKRMVKIGSHTGQEYFLPVGPRNKKDPTGRFCTWRPALDIRTASDTAATT